MSHGYVVLAALALTSACTGSSGKPQVLPSLTGTPSNTPGPVVVPSAAAAHTPAGAAAFVRFFYGQVDAAYQAADPGLVAGLSDSSCGTCAAFVTAIRDLQAKGQHMEGIAVRVLSAEAPPEQNGIVSVDVQADAPARRVVDANGKVVQTGKADPAYHLTVFVKHTGTGWVVRAVKRI